jgi:hypothetical protein
MWEKDNSAVLTNQIGEVIAVILITVQFGTRMSRGRVRGLDVSCDFVAWHHLYHQSGDPVIHKKQHEKWLN